MHLPAPAYRYLAYTMFQTLTVVITCMSALKLLADAAPYKQSRGSHAYAAGVAYWEHDYLNGATNSDNLVRRKDSTFTNILLPAAKAVGRKIAALPTVNGCVPGQLPDRHMWVSSSCLLHSRQTDVLLSGCAYLTACIWHGELGFRGPDWQSRHSCDSLAMGALMNTAAMLFLLAGSATHNQPLELWNNHSSQNELLTLVVFTEMLLLADEPAAWCTLAAMQP